MASIVNTSLDIIRRHKSRPAHLHTRWGDVAITAPVDGAWSQLHNPYLHEHVEYGPGYVPELEVVENKEVLILDPGAYSSDGDDEKMDGDILKKENDETRSKAVSRAKRLTRILLPSSVNVPMKKSEERNRSVDFQYKPVIHPDYGQEVVEKMVDQNKPHFRYVPVSKHYMRELRRDLQSNGASKNYHLNETDNDADDENDGKKGHNRTKRPQRLRSHSYESHISSHHPNVRRQKSRFQQDASLQTTNNTPTNRSPLSEHLPSSIVAGMPTLQEHTAKYDAASQAQKQSTQPTATSRSLMVQHSKPIIDKSHRRSMTLEMVGNQDDLWY